uniref:Uncharacterized protein n=1 Tax=viral metagenome TaxID=1070528 RepID=A0A6C0H679_9ZZZZ
MLFYLQIILYWISVIFIFIFFFYSDKFYNLFIEKKIINDDDEYGIPFENYSFNLFKHFNIQKLINNQF